MESPIHSIALSPEQLGVLQACGRANLAAEAYTFTTCFRITPEVDVARLLTALSCVIRRHPLLRYKLAQQSDGTLAFVETEDEIWRQINEAQIDLNPSDEAFAGLVSRELEAYVALGDPMPFAGVLFHHPNGEHTLLMLANHAITDFRSQWVICRDLVDAYANPRRAQCWAVDQSFSVYSKERELAQHSPEHRIGRAFWANLLSGSPPLVQLHNARQRPETQSYAGSSIDFAFLPREVESIRDCAKAFSLTPFSVLLTAWIVVLSRFSSANDLVVGVAAGRREDERFRESVGLFAGLLPLRIDIRTSESFSSLARRVQAGIREARRHQTVGFDQIVRDVCSDRSVSHAPLIQSAFSWPIAPECMWESDQLQLHAHPLTLQRFGIPPELSHTRTALISALCGSTISPRTSKFDISPTAWLVGNDLLCQVEYSTDLFDQSSAREVVQRWRYILSDACSAPDQPIRNISWLDHGEAAALTSLGKGPPLRKSRFSTVNALEWSLVDGESRAAITWDQGSISLRELAASTHKLSVTLLELGVEAGSIVVVMASRSPELIRLVLALWRIGAAFAPASADCTSRRLMQLIDSARPSLIVADREASTPGSVGVPSISLDGLVAAAESRSADTSLLHPSAERLGNLPAYLILTSGSSGSPKAVAVSHANVCAFADALYDQFSGDDVERVLLGADFCFDAFVLELVLALRCRATLCVPGPEYVAIGDDFCRAVKQFSVTHAFLSASALAASNPVPRSSLPTLSCILTGGDKLVPAVAYRWSRHFDVVNLYGPTEVTVACTAMRIACGSPQPSAAIGRPLSGYDVRVVDESLTPVPIGSVGQIVVSGPCVTLGYANAPAPTEARYIVRQPSVGSAFERLYLTGDLGRWDSTGCLHFVGRMDFQLKIHGYRVDPEEIERAIVDIGKASAACVLPLDKGDVKHLIGFVAGSTFANTASLLQALRLSLPSYVVPQHVELLSALPINSLGKVDRDQLHALGMAALDASQVEREAPNSEVESLVRGVWESVLGTEIVNADTPFFAAGGSSISAAQVITRLRGLLAADLHIRDIFRHSTIRGLTRLIQALNSEEGGDAIPPARSGECLPCSFAQRRLWFLSVLDRAQSRAYHMSMAVRVFGALDAARLVDSLDAVLARHESMRTTFVARAGEPCQRIAPSVQVPLHHWSLVTEAAPVEELAQIWRSALDEPFDLERGPLVRASLVRMEEHQWVLILVMHHIISDGWSMGVLGDELAEHYSAAVEGREARLPELHVQYRDYSHWQRQRLESGRCEGSLDYWRRQLADAPPLTVLHGDRIRPPEQDFQGGLLDLEFSKELSLRVREAARALDSTPYMFLLAAWAVVIARMSGQNDLIIGSPTANRDRIEIEPLIGFFVNALPLRITIEDGMSGAALIARVRECVLDALRHQEVPFERIVEEVNPDRGLGHHPLFQIAFAWQNAPRSDLRFSGLKVEPLGYPHHTTSLFDLALHAWERGDAIVGHIEYASALFERGSIIQLLSCWQRVAAALCADPETSVSRIDLVDPDERTLQLQRFVSHAAEAPTVSVPDALARWSQQSPLALAIECGGKHITFHDLDLRSRRLAAALMERGVGRGDRIATLLPSSIDAVIAWLAVWRTGSAYVPLDPEHPRERLAGLLDDLDPALVLTRSEEAGSDDLRTDVRLQRAVPLETLLASGECSRTRGDAGGVSPDAVAYLIYTSGSSGAPKAVMVPHRGLSHLVTWHHRHFALLPGERCSWMANVAFDASVWEVWATLASGATLVIPPRSQSRDLEVRLRWWASCRLDIGFLPTPLAELAFHRRWINRHLRALLIGGDALHALPAHGLPCELHNNYGPTEASVVATSGLLDSRVDRIHVGRPLPGTRIYVLDQHAQLLPVGAVGEVCIGGPGLAIGYWRQPELTAHLFVADPFVPGERMYRTGDLGRWDRDGRLTLLGRLDEQVKIRGHRIEVAEVEACIASQPGITGVAVVAPRSGGGSRSLHAFVSFEPSRHGDGSQSDETLVDAWREFYETTYLAPQAETSADDFVGWNDSARGDPIPLDEMRAWRDEAVARIRALAPRSILEIGVGTGLLLSRLAPHCDRYVGTDLSAAALRRLRTRLAPEWIDRVELHVGPAHALPKLGDSRFDVIVLNSVVQYFPGEDYLRRLLDRLPAMLTERGCVFLGDIRHAGLLHAFHRHVLLGRGEVDDQDPSFAARIERAVLLEKELAISPDWFRRFAAQLDSPMAVRAIPKYFQASNELSSFRFDVILHRVAESGIRSQPRIVDAQGFTEDDLLAALKAHQGQALIITNLRNARLGRAQSNDVFDADSPGIEVSKRGAQPKAWMPSELINLAQANGYCAELSWIDCEQPETFRLLCGADAAELQSLHSHARSETVPRGELISSPGATSVRERQLERLQSALVDRLPQYMHPRLHWLPSLPLTARGKIDKRALERRAELQAGAAGRAPHGALEKAIHDIWCRLLGLHSLSVDESFFAAGGHSLLAVRAVASLRDATGVEVQLADLFSHPTIAQLAGELGQRTSARPSSEEAQLKPARSKYPPLSAAQRRIWFMSRIGAAASAAYHLPLVFRFDGEFSTASLRAAVLALVARHESLRTRFPMAGASPFQEVMAADDPVLVEKVWVEVGNHADLDGTVESVNAIAFDLQSGPGFRAALWRSTDARSAALVLIFHHIAVDGWSLGIVQRDLPRLYQLACGQGDESDLGPVAQPLDMVAEAEPALFAAEHEELARWWAEQLAGVPPLLALPADRLRQTRQSFRGSALECVIDRSLLSALETLGRRHGATPYQVLLSGWAITLSRLAGVTDLVIGTVSTGRHTHADHLAVGLYVNTLPVRVDLSHRPSVVEVLHRVRDAVTRALAHQSLPFDRIVESVSQPRSQAYAPLFQVAFAYFDQSVCADWPAEMQGSLWPAPIRHSAYDLTLSITRSEATAEVRIVFDPMLFDRSTVQGFLDRWRAVLESMCHGEFQHYDRIEWLSADERRDLLALGVPPACAGEAAAPTLHGWFRHTAGEHPRRIAISWPGGSLDYAGLELLSDMWAQRLISLGIAEGDRIGLCLRRGPWQVVMLLAALKAGACFVPLDPRHPADRLRFALEDCEAKLFVIDAASPQLAPLGVRLLVLDQLQLPPTNEGDSSQTPLLPTLDDRAAARSIAYLIYTSGSTGAPKGVMVEHRHVVSMLLEVSCLLPCERPHRVLQVSSFGFDAFVLELAACWVSGGALCYPEECEVFAGASLAEALISLTPTLAVMTPSAAASIPHKYLAQLPEVVVFGGEQLPSQLIGDWIHGRKVFNAYGPTECTVIASAMALTTVARRDERVAIGRPTCASRVYVLDAWGEPTPIGVIGEIAIGGQGVARGYWRRPELTAERFVADPFSDMPDARMYLSGDLGRWRRDGTLEFIGRLDSQVKLRGLRIELGEIEALLSARSDVRDVTVELREDQPGLQFIVAYLVAEGSPADAEALRIDLAARLPAFMVPSFFVWLEALPLTRNGKLDRSALPAPARCTDVTNDGEPPSGELEEQIASVWAELLGVPRVFRHDDFFALGGHSLLLVQLAHRLSSMGMDVELGALLSHPTVCSLAAHLTSSGPRCEAESVIRLRDGVDPPLIALADGTGMLLYAAELARRLTSPVSIVGVGSPSDLDQHGLTVEGLAEVLADRVPAVNSGQAIRLVGWSFGGIVALELGRVLQARGAVIDFVAMLDSVLLTKQALQASTAIEKDALLATLRTRAIADPDIRSGLGTLEQEVELLDLDQLIEMCERLIGSSSSDGTGETELTCHLHRQHRVRAAILRYRPSPVPFTVHLFEAVDGAERGKRTSAEHWARALVTQDFHLHQVGGDHFSMLQEPHIDRLCDTMSRLIDRDPTLH